MKGECKSSICEENKCRTRLNGEDCYEHSQCRLLSYCTEKTSKCNPLFKEGEIWSNSFECGFDFTCTNNVFIKMFSLPVGANTNHWEACQTANSFEIEVKEFWVD